MGESINPGNKSRRWFLSGGLMGAGKKEMVKMLTPDGKLVEIEKAVLDAATKQTASNKEIMDWMDNPSKEKD